MQTVTWSVRRVAAPLALAGVTMLGGIAGALTTPPAAAQTPALTISTENTGSHSQTRTLDLFAERLNARLHGQLKVELRDSAALYRDREVTEALSTGRVAFAAPGIWHLSRFLPDFNILQLPMVYGRAAEPLGALVDGALGTALNAQLEDRFNVHVIGRWLDLGHAHLFTAGKPVTGPEDIADLRIRVAGGFANQWRIRQLGGQSMVIAWPDFPEALESNLVDGTLTTATTVASAQLWERGLTHAYLDHQYYPYYVPMIADAVWKRLSAEQRHIITDTWSSVVETGRQMAAAQQADALARLQRHGVKVIRPDAATLAATRARLMAGQDALVAELGLTPALVAAARKQLDNAAR